MVGLFFTIIAVLSVVYMITRAVSCRNNSDVDRDDRDDLIVSRTSAFLRECNDLIASHHVDRDDSDDLIVSRTSAFLRECNDLIASCNEASWATGKGRKDRREQYWKEQKRLREQRMKELEDYLQNIVANEELVLVNHDNINIVCDWWESAIESRQITESNLHKRLRLHLNTTGSLRRVYITNASRVWVPPLYGASSIEVYVRPGDKVVEGDTGHNKILCSGVVPSDIYIPYLRGDVAKIISEQSKRAKEVIERATAIKKIFDEIVCAKLTDSTPNPIGFRELVDRCREELKDMKVPEKVLNDFDWDVDLLFGRRLLRHGHSH